MKRRLVRWYDYVMPPSLFGRMVLVLVMGLVLEQAISGFIFFQERQRLEFQSRAQRMAQRVADLVRLLDGMTLEERVKFTPLAETRYFGVYLPGEPAPAMQTDDAGDNPERLHTLELTLAQLLGKPRVLSVSMSGFETAIGSSDAFPSLAGGQVSQLVPGLDERELYSQVFFAEVALADGTRVGFRYIVPGPLPGTLRNFILNMLVRLMVILGLSLLAVRTATRPLATLAAAAERLGKDIQQPSLAETGPVEVRRAARAFNSMQERLLALLSDRTRMLAAISHDLKTPITRMRLRAELLDDALLKAKLVKDLAEMDSMVSATLEFMHTLDNREPIQSIDMLALLESMQEDAQEIGRLFSVSGSAQPYPGHLLALRRCLGNLLDNAIKYGQRAEVLIEDGKQALTIRVRDHGPGIPENQLSRVFEPFFRLDESRSRDTGGSGLGLAIALSCAQSHGGSLLLRNLLRGGLEAELVLPRPDMDQV